ncbi:auxin-induced protein 22D-like [Primulina huaijiensis]|uniref:auxin-induced protein 22D-like n=1 Tax=Primulina huaijiensis TaxID=1492673 RepID=UPI003CC78FD3
MICMTKMNRGMMGKDQSDINLKATELRLGLPGSDECHQDMTSFVAKNNKRASPELTEDSRSNGIILSAKSSEPELPPAPKAHIVGWPPVRSYRKNNIEAKNSEPEAGGMYVKVSMDGAPYLRKMDLKVYNGYSLLLEALEIMFKFSMGNN